MVTARRISRTGQRQTHLDRIVEMFRAMEIEPTQAEVLREYRRQGGKTGNIEGRFAAKVAIAKGKSREIIVTEAARGRSATGNLQSLVGIRQLPASQRAAAGRLMGAQLDPSLSERGVPDFDFVAFTLQITGTYIVKRNGVIETQGTATIQREIVQPVDRLDYRLMLDRAESMFEGYMIQRLYNISDSYVQGLTFQTTNLQIREVGRAEARG